MRVAVPVTEDGQVDHSWGRAPRVAVAEVQDGRVAGWQEFDVEWDRLHDEGTEGGHHARVARFLQEHQVDRVAANHMGPGMTQMLAQMGIGVVLGAAGDARRRGHTGVTRLLTRPESGPKGTSRPRRPALTSARRSADSHTAMRSVAVNERSLPDPTAPHETKANSVLRPIVFGANDGLVSNLALVMGVAGANPAPEIIVLAGVAGLIAGAFSMGVGEYISVQSQRELLDFQYAFQHKQLREAADQERSILIRSYVDRGLPEEDATRFADILLKDPEHAARLLIFEEVGLDDRSIGSPLQAAVGSFIAFTTGAFIPLLPFLIATGQTAFVASVVASLGALALLGTAIALLTRRALWYGALRQVLLGGLAAAVTYGVGSLLGVSVSS